MAGIAPKGMRTLIHSALSLFALIALKVATVAATLADAVGGNNEVNL